MERVSAVGNAGAGRPASPGRESLFRERLWNGNREPLRNLLSWQPSKSIIRWSWTQHAKYRERYTTAMSLPSVRHITFVRLTSHAAADSWLSDLRAGRSPGRG